MNILMTIHTDFDRNAGAAGVTYRLSREYEQMGHTVEIYSFDNLPTTIPTRFKILAFPFFVARHLNRTWQRRSVDVVDATTGDTLIWAGRAKSRQRPLLVTRSHGLEHTAHLALDEEVRRGNARLSRRYRIYRGGLLLRQVAMSLRQADLILVLSRHDLEYTTKVLNIPSERVRLLRNGIANEFLGLSIEETPARQVVPLRIAVIGSYLPKKGTEYGRLALSAALRADDNLRVAFFGTGCSPETVLRDYDAIVHERISVVPHYDNSQLPDLLRGYLIHVFPSLFEGFSSALIESMACGLTPIVTESPGVAEVIENGVNGFVVGARNPLLLTAAIQHLTTDRRLLDRLRRGAHSAAQRYRWPDVARQTLQLYEAAIASKSGHAPSSRDRINHVDGNPKTG